MELKQFSLASILLFAGAAPVWIFLTFEVARSPGFAGGHSLVRWAFGPAVLLIATCAIHRLLPKHQARTALATLLAGAILLGAIVAVATFERLRAYPKRLVGLPCVFRASGHRLQ